MDTKMIQSPASGRVPPGAPIRAAGRPLPSPTSRVPAFCHHPLRGYPPSARRGASLIEVLVVLVVLVIGIFGVARLFPTGFGTIRYTEHTTVAQGLARAQEEWFRAHAPNLMLGIVALRPIDPAGDMDVDPTLDPRAIFVENKFLAGEGPA